MTQSKESRPKGKQKVHETETESAKRVQAKGESLKAELDELLDEIDDVLEENASEVLVRYVQRGGE